MNEFLDSDLYKIGAPIVGYFAGIATILLQRLTLTKKEKLDFAQKEYENTKQLLQDQSDRFQAFCEALEKYNNKDGSVSFDDFISIATTGEKYFYQQLVTSNAILAGRVEQNARDSTFVPKLIETAEKMLPRYYAALQRIARDKGYTYSGKLERKNYESIFLVVEKYGAIARREP